MSKVEIHLPDGSIKEFDHAPTVLEVAQTIGERLAQDTVAGQLSTSDELIDLRTPLASGSHLKIITLKDEMANEVIRHSSAHIMAQAVQELWEDVQVTIGPVIENGFFYDFYKETPFVLEDLEKIENQFAKIVKQDLPIVREDWPVDEAIDVFEKLGENFKVELIKELKSKGETTVGVYKQGEWFDLCRGPHIQRTGQVKAFKMLHFAGSYWRGDETKARLQRVYGTAFQDKKALKEYLFQLEEAKKRDHRKLGKELGLFHFHDLSPGGPFFSPKGTVIYNELQNFIRSKYVKYDYKEIITPQIFDVDLYHQSGHYENYKENMYFTQIDERDFSLKPMNCPGHCLHFSSEHRSYRDLPLRVADFGRLHRYERSGVMHGLTRVRTFCQDDAHIFCDLKNLQSEIQSFMELLNEVYQDLGLSEYRIYLSTRPEKRMGSDEIWDQAEGALEKALQNLDLEYKVNPGDGAFYGPKLDIMFVDALKRPWQLGTLQCDFNMPEAFKLKFIGSDNSEHRPVMLHRAILGSLERFIGVYLEHTAGHWPTWLSPVQVIVMNLTDRQKEDGLQLYNRLKECGLRVELDLRSEKLGFKIREAQLQKIPYMVVLGDKEVSEGTLSVRLKNGSTKYGLKLQDFIDNLKSDIEGRNQKMYLYRDE